MVTWPVQIRRATLSDIKKIKHITDQYKQELGFVHTGKIKQAINKGYCHVADSIGGVVGFVIFYTRKDTWTTVYDIAVDPRFTRIGIGRKLLNSVPTPTQLKCTSNNPSNMLYKICGFKLIGTENGKQQRLNIWKRRYLYIICRGSFKKIRILPLYELGFEYGTRHTEIPYHQPYMVDIHWEDYVWSDYLDKLKLWKPTFALVPDYEQPNPDMLLRHIEDLKMLNIPRIGVCPKFKRAVYDIPPECIICVSIPTKYAGFLPNESELINRRIHLLGGSPQKQLKYIQQHPNLHIMSMDGNAFVKAAFYRTIYLGHSNKWKNKRALKYIEFSSTTAMELSLSGIAYSFYQNQEYK